MRSKILVKMAAFLAYRWRGGHRPLARAFERREAARLAARQFAIGKLGAGPGERRGPYPRRGRGRH